MKLGHTDIQSKLCKLSHIILVHVCNICILYIYIYWYYTLVRTSNAKLNNCNMMLNQY